MAVGDVNQDQEPDILLGPGMWKELKNPQDRFDKYYYYSGKKELLSVLFLVNR